MSTAALLQIAEAVAARLAAAAGELAGLAGYTIDVGFIPQTRLTDLAESGRIDIIGKSRASSIQSRNAKQRTHEIDILIRRRATNTGELPTEAIVDAFLALVAEIGDLFEGRRLEDYPAAMCTGWTNAPAWDPVHLEQHTQLTSLLTLTFTSHV